MERRFPRLGPEHDVQRVARGAVWSETELCMTEVGLKSFRQTLLEHGGQEFVRGVKEADGAVC